MVVFLPAPAWGAAGAPSGAVVVGTGLAAGGAAVVVVLPGGAGPGPGGGPSAAAGLSAGPGWPAAGLSPVGSGWFGAGSWWRHSRGVGAVRACQRRPARRSAHRPAASPARPAHRPPQRVRRPVPRPVPPAALPASSAVAWDSWSLPTLTPAALAAVTSTDLRWRAGERRARDRARGAGWRATAAIPARGSRDTAVAARISIAHPPRTSE